MTDRHTADLPWMIPVPVKRSSFQPVLPQHRPLNVEVDLSQMRAFEVASAVRDPKSLLYADLQTNADSNIDRRLGSGRAGFYRGHYLKGVGRTSLAGNWNQTLDVYHSSGMLLPSGAIREFVVSLYLKNQAKSHLVTACTGLLFRELSDKNSNHARAAFDPPARRGRGKDLHGLSAVDKRFHAISIKTGDFYRFSNFAWWLGNFPQRLASVSTVEEFFRLFYDALASRHGSVDKHDVDADEIVSRFIETLERGIDSFLESWKLGVSWGSLHNNFTMDGRFLDLETPLVLPFPTLGRCIDCFGSYRNKESYVDERFFPHLGGEALGYAQQVGLFIAFLRSRLSFFVEQSLVSAPERDFIRGFLRSLEKRFHVDHPCRSPHALAERLMPAISKELALSRKEATIVFRALAPTRRSPRPAMKLYRLPLAGLAKPEPNVLPGVYVPSFMRDRTIPRAQMGFDYNEVVTSLEREVDLSRLLARLRKLTQG